MEWLKISSFDETVNNLIQQEADSFLCIHQKTSVMSHSVMCVAQELFYQFEKHPKS